MKKVILDTNVYASLFRGDEVVLDILGRANTVFMSIFVLGELYAGFKGGNKELENCRQLDNFLQKSTVRIMTATQETSLIFGTIKQNLKLAGMPIPINDVWIAAHSMESGAHLLTYDKHFNHIAGLLVWNNLEK